MLTFNHIFEQIFQLLLVLYVSIANRQRPVVSVDEEIDLKSLSMIIFIPPTFLTARMKIIFFVLVFFILATSMTIHGNM